MALLLVSPDHSVTTLFFTCWSSPCDSEEQRTGEKRKHYFQILNIIAHLVTASEGKKKKKKQGRYAVALACLFCNRSSEASPVQTGWQDVAKIPHPFSKITIRKGDNHFSRRQKSILPASLSSSYVLFTSRIIFMSLTHADNTSHLNSLQRRRWTNRKLRKSHLVGEHNLQNAAVQGLTRECGRNSCRHSGIIVVHKPHQLVQDLPLTPNSERREPRRLYSFYSLHTHRADWVQTLGQVKREADK